MSPSSFELLILSNDLNQLIGLLDTSYFSVNAFCLLWKRDQKRRAFVVHVYQKRKLNEKVIFYVNSLLSHELTSFFIQHKMK